MAIGKIATKSVIRQPTGTNGATARMIIATIPSKLIAKLNLNLLSTLGTSIKKLENSASLDVAPHCMLYSNMCASSAEETWRDKPPRKMANMTTHLKFSRSEPKKVWVPRR
jgi:hypothetical protein